MNHIKNIYPTSAKKNMNFPGAISRMRINICDLFNFVPESAQQCHIFPIIIIIISSLHFREMRLFVTVGTTKVKLTSVPVVPHNSTYSLTSCWRRSCPPRSSPTSLARASPSSPFRPEPRPWTRQTSLELELVSLWRLSSTNLP